VMSVGLGAEFWQRRVCTGGDSPVTRHPDQTAGYRVRALGVRAREAYGAARGTPARTDVFASHGDAWCPVGVSIRSSGDAWCGCNGDDAAQAGGASLPQGANSVGIWSVTVERAAKYQVGMSGQGGASRGAKCRVWRAGALPEGCAHGTPVFGYGSRHPFDQSWGQ
jgi:hypothetical protein